MAEERKAKLRLEIAHVLFIDIVGYSKFLIDEQSETLQKLNQIVRQAAAVCEAEAAGELIRLPSGDGMALVFTRSAEAAVESALAISVALGAGARVPVRMGIHSGAAGGGCQRADQHCRLRDQHRAAGDGLRRRRPHSSLEMRRRRSRAVSPLASRVCTTWVSAR